MGYPPPKCEQTDTCENSTFPRTSYAGYNNGNCNTKVILKDLIYLLLSNITIVRCGAGWCLSWNFLEDASRQGYFMRLEQVSEKGDEPN